MPRYTAYDTLARVYDSLWRFYVPRVLPVLDRMMLRDLSPGAHVLDLCCGTGELALHLRNHGFKVTGLDGSEAMLDVARLKVPTARFLLADARAFEAQTEFDAVVSTFDSLNHVMTLKELERVFRNVHSALRTRGSFVFDLNLRAGFLERWQETGAHVEDDLVCATESSFDAAEGVGRIRLTLFEVESGKWTRRDLTLTQRCYDDSEVIGALQLAGFQDVTVSVEDAHSKLGGRGFFRGVRA